MSDAGPAQAGDARPETDTDAARSETDTDAARSGTDTDAARPETDTDAARSGTDTDAARAETDAARREQGMRVRREVLGDAHVDRAIARTTEFTEPFQDLITRYAWGDIWSRPGLSRTERSMITLTALAALGREGELAMHVRAAVRNGLTPEQIGEVLLQVAVYAGVPAANSAFAIAQQVLAELGAEDAPQP